MPPDPATPTPNDHDNWGTLKRFLPYLWPKDNPALKRRIVFAFMFVLLAKATILSLPFAYKNAVDRMTTPSNEAFMVAMALVIAYAAGRFTSVAFDNLRNITFERVGQDATRKLAEDVFHRLHRLSLRFHLSRRTGEVTKIIERGTKSIDSMLYFLLFNIAPTIIELIAVGIIFYLNFGWELVAATAVTVITYISVTRWITEWRTKLRREMNDLDGRALDRAVDSLLNYETVKYFGAESREEERYASAARAYAEAARGVSFRETRRIALQAALIPMINSLFAVGLVSLPGMMTGQILSGVSPLIAARYQIMVMCMIFASAILSAVFFLILVKNKTSQLPKP